MTCFTVLPGARSRQDQPTGRAAGCSCRHLLSPAEALAWGDAQLPIQPPFPGSCFLSGGGPCAAVMNPGVVCAPWMLPQAGKPLPVRTMPLPQGTSHCILPSDAVAGPSSRCRSPFSSILLTVQRVLLSLCFRMNSKLKESCWSPSQAGPVLLRVCSF